jgi:hypothetical protein
MTGKPLWAQRYSNPGGDDDEARAIALDANGDVYVTGESKGAGTGYDFATLKYISADGTQAWLARFNSGGANNDLAVGIAVDNRFNVYVAGQAYNNLNYTLIKCVTGLPAVKAVISSITLSSSVFDPAAGFSFQVSIPPGQTYIVLASDDLLRWAPIATNVAVSSADTFTDTTAVYHPNRFYRVMTTQ